MSCMCMCMWVSHAEVLAIEDSRSLYADTGRPEESSDPSDRGTPPVRQAPPVHSVAPRSSLPTAARPPAACSSSLCALLRGFRRAGGAPSRSADSPERAGAEVSAAQAAAPAERRHRSRRRQHSRHRTVRRTDATSSSRQVESVSISQPASAEGSARTAARVLAERRQAPRCATDSASGGQPAHGYDELPRNDRVAIRDRQPEYIPGGQKMTVPSLSDLTTRVLESAGSRAPPPEGEPK